MSKIVLYSHGGSGNHGCEAIVRGTFNVLHGEVDELYSYRPKEDIKYGLNEILNIKEHKSFYPHFSLKRLKASLLVRLFHNDEYAEKITYDALFKNLKKGDIALSIGGDNYCYSSYKEHAILNKYLNKMGVKTVLWECSVEPSLIDEEMKKDLEKYSLIVARETISYEALKKVNNNVIYSPDPAFVMNSEKSDDNYKLFFEKETIGINISPVVIEYSKHDDIVLKNVYVLIDYILQNTEYNIALIPHVSWEFTNDTEILTSIKNHYAGNKRIILIPEMEAKKLKYIISKCSLFIGSRTHATIAAYSSNVPTLVLGYSVKAKGIAKDIFGSYEKFVISTQELNNFDELKNAFIWLDENKSELKKHLVGFMPKYIEPSNLVFKEIQKLKG